MFKTILWATDGSETAARALPYALGLAETDKASSSSRTCARSSSGAARGYPVLADETELRDTIHHQVEELRTEGLDATFVVRTCTSGHAAGTIAEIAR